MAKIKKYEILPHLADLKIRTFGKTKEEVFSNILEGMTDSQKPEIGDQKVIERKIKIKSMDLPNLLVDFLSELLYLSQVNKEIYFDVKFKKLSDKELDAGIFGQKIKRFGEDIKAVTYHNLDIHQKEDRTWEATVLFDI